MSLLFFVFCGLSLCFCLIRSPDLALTAMLNGANKALSLCFSLAAVYAVWMGIYGVLEKAGVSKRIAGVTQPLVNKLFNAPPKEIGTLICNCLSANMLGLGGIATPLAIEACAKAQASGREDVIDLLIVISATSVQLLPTSVMALAAENASKSPSSLILPSLICTLFSTAAGIFLLFAIKKAARFFSPRGGRRRKEGQG